MSCPTLGLGGVRKNERTCTWSNLEELERKEEGIGTWKDLRGTFPLKSPM